MNWSELLNQMAHWQYVTFPETTLKGAAKHLEKESMEIISNTTDAEEWADALFMCVQGGTLAAGSLSRFKTVVEKKLLKNQQREWPAKPDASNVYEHVKPDVRSEPQT